MAIYSISDLSKLSGVKAHTIRAWETRYALIEPKRTPTNIRFYQDEDLKKLLGIAMLNRHGMKISKIAKLDEQQRAEAISKISSISFQPDTQLDALTLSMIELDEFKFSHILNTNIEQLGFEKTMLEVIYPFLDKLSLLWLTGSVSPVQEAFISQLIRQKIISATDRLPPLDTGSEPTVVLYLREEERQELTALFAHFMLRQRGVRSIYLGHDISITDLVDAHRFAKPNYFFTILSKNTDQQPATVYIKQLLRQFPNVDLLLTGYQAMVSKPPAGEERVHILRSLQETVDFFDQLKPSN